MKAKENKSLFLMQFGDTPQLRVMDFLIDNHFFDYPMTEIAKESNISYNSLKLFFPQLVKSGILIKTRKIGKSNYVRNVMKVCISEHPKIPKKIEEFFDYKLNLNNLFAKNLIKLDWN